MRTSAARGASGGGRCRPPPPRASPRRQPGRSEGAGNGRAGRQIKEVDEERRGRECGPSAPAIVDTVRVFAPAIAFRRAATITLGAFSIALLALSVSAATPTLPARACRCSATRSSRSAPAGNAAIALLITEVSAPVLTQWRRCYAKATGEPRPGSRRVWTRRVNKRIEQVLEKTSEERRVRLSAPEVSRNETKPNRK